jgi:hypothetical protein
METEKRIGDFRVNRKVSWGISFPQKVHTALSVQKPQRTSLCAGFVHSLGVETRAHPGEPSHTLDQARDRVWILVPQPAIGVRPRGAWMDVQVGPDDDLLDILQQPALEQALEGRGGQRGEEIGQATGAGAGRS